MAKTFSKRRNMDNVEKLNNPYSYLKFHITTSEKVVRLQGEILIELLFQAFEHNRSYQNNKSASSLNWRNIGRKQRKRRSPESSISPEQEKRRLLYC